MGDIVFVNSFGKAREYAEGEAICTNCKHVWEAVVPTGTTQLECPECNTFKGVLRYPFNASEDDVSFICMCGSEYFYATLENGYTNLRCRECGVNVTDEILEGTCY